MKEQPRKARSLLLSVFMGWGWGGVKPVTQFTSLGLSLPICKCRGKGGADIALGPRSPSGHNLVFFPQAVTQGQLWWQP